MNKQKLMTARTILLALTLAVLVTIPTAIARAQASEPSTNENQVSARQGSVNGYCDWLCQFREQQAQALEGSWIMTVSLTGPQQPPPFITYGTFARGGAFIASDRSAPAVHHGVWAHLGGNRFAVISKVNSFDKMGNFTSTLEVRHTISVTGKDTFVGVSSAEARDAAGNLLVTFCGTLRGDRIKIEPLAEQCQSITPPQ